MLKCLQIQFLLFAGISHLINMDSLAPQTHKFDVIIVGAGPAGSSCALFLAKAGRRVLLVDKAKFPREKICGDAVSGKSINIIRELGLLDELNATTHGIVEGVKLVAPNGKEVTVPFQKAIGMDCAGYCLPRSETDNILAQAAAKEKNITFIQNFNADQMIKNSQGAVIGIEGGIPPKVEKYYSRVVVGADGAASVVSRNAGLKGNPPEHNYMGIRGYYNEVEGLENNIELFFIDEVLPGYLWIFPLGRKRANVGLGILASDMKNRKIHPNNLLENAIRNSPKLKDRFTNSAREGKIGAWTIPLGSHKKQLHGEGWVLLGDAASLVDPFSGEGFGNAASSGKFAAQTIDSALKTVGEKEFLDSEALEPYAKKVETELYPEMETTYKLQRATRFKFMLNLFISKAADKLEFRQMIVDMLASNEQKKKVEDPLFYLRLLLP